MTENSGATQSMYSGDLTFMGCSRWVGKLPAHSVAVVGVPFDGATSNRPGARLGPRAIRTASKMLAWERLYGWEESIYLHSPRVYDCGDVEFDYGRNDLETCIQAKYEEILSAGAKPLTIGGDHYISYPILKTIYNHAAHREPIALIQFDAHTDTWKDEKGRVDHGTGFYHAIDEGMVDPESSIQIGIRTHNDDTLGVEIIDMSEMNRLSADELVARIKKRIGTRKAYLTFDIDGLDPAYAPGTGTPAIGGMSSGQALEILRKMKGIDLLGADLVEVSPAYDHSEITALAGATILAYQGQLLCGSL